MDPKMHKELMDYLIKGDFPENTDKHQRYVLKRRATKYCVKDDQLYYFKHKGSDKEMKAKVVCGASEANSVFEEFHASKIGAHCGQVKTRDAISLRYYWPAMTSDINKWVSECTVCQQNKTEIKVAPDYKPIKTTRPFELVGMDLIGKLVQTDEGNQYICVMIDYCTRWAQAYAIKNKSAAEVTRCILKFVYQFEVPQRILTDQGKEFVNNINAEVCRFLGIKRSLCAPYHPQTNGLVERLNGTIQRALAKLVKDKAKNWELYLDPVMFGLRTKKQLTTRFSPFYLMFGREARYPSEVAENYQVDGSFEHALLEEEVAIDIERQDKILNIVQGNQDAVQQKTRARLQCQKHQVVQAGDLVLRQNIRSQQRKGGKLDPEYLGPYTVTKVEGKSVDLVDNMGKSISKVSIDHLKIYKEETPRVPKHLIDCPPVSTSSTLPAAITVSATTTPDNTTIPTATKQAVAITTTSTSPVAATTVTTAEPAAATTMTTSTSPVTATTVTTTEPAAATTMTTSTSPVTATTEPAAATTMSTSTSPVTATTVTTTEPAAATTMTTSTSPVTATTEPAAATTMTTSTSPVTATTVTTTEPAAATTMTTSTSPVTATTVTTTEPAAATTMTTSTSPVTATTEPAAATTMSTSTSPVTATTVTTTEPAAATTMTTSTSPVTATTEPAAATTMTTSTSPVTATTEPAAATTMSTSTSPVTATTVTTTEPAAATTMTTSTSPVTATTVTTTEPAAATTMTTSTSPVTATTVTTTEPAAATTTTAKLACATMPASTLTAHASSWTPSALTPAAKSSLKSEKYVQEAWEGKDVHVLLSRIGAYKIFYWDINRTGPQKELESEVINAYLWKLVSKHNSKGGKQALFMDSYAMTDIWNRKKKRVKCDPTSYSIVLGAVHEPNHWIFTAIFPSERRSVVLDSSGRAAFKVKQCLESTRSFMRLKGCNVSRWKADTIKHSLQKDGTSCGIFVLKFAEKVLAEESPIFNNSAKAVEAYRREVAVVLLNETDDLGDLCHYCGEKEDGTAKSSTDGSQNNTTDWIQCDQCGRWYHKSCVGKPESGQSFNCLACL